MSDIRQFSPLWGEWIPEEELGKGSFGTVWKVSRTVAGDLKFYAAVKHISIPADESEISHLIDEGAILDEPSAREFYEGKLKSLLDEIQTMYKLQGYTNIVSYEDHKIVPKKGGIGYDVFLRMELLEPLTDKIKEGISLREIVRLGKDIGTALMVMSKMGMVHRDIKPQNIFVNPIGAYKLGDYGTARALSGKAAAMSVKGTYNYMAPEIYKNQAADATVDLYSLGLVLYRLVNKNRLPFLPLSGTVTNDQSEEALVRRLRGEPLAPPKSADNGLAAIILKACAYRPDERFRTAEEFVDALGEYERYLEKGPQPGKRPMTAEELVASLNRNVASPGQKQGNNAWHSLTAEELVAALNRGKGVKKPEPAKSTAPAPEDATVVETEPGKKGAPGVRGAGSQASPAGDRTVIEPAHVQPTGRNHTAGNSEDRTVIEPAPVQPTGKNHPAGTPEDQTVIDGPEPKGRETPQGKTTVPGKTKTTSAENSAEERSTRKRRLTRLLEEEKRDEEPQGKKETVQENRSAAEVAKPSRAPAEKPGSGVKPGQIVLFGAYTMDPSAKGKQAIEWFVLAAEGDRVLLLSRYGLDVQPYHAGFTGVTWENSSLRVWLNKEFMNEAFSPAEKQAILKVRVDNHPGQGYPGWKAVLAEKDTQDSVFLLSFHEAYEQYIAAGDNASRVAPATPYTASRKAFCDKGGCRWWLRSTGKYQRSAACVNPDGSLYYFFTNYDHGCVRPAVWVSQASGLIIPG